MQNAADALTPQGLAPSTPSNPVVEITDPLTERWDREWLSAVAWSADLDAPFWDVWQGTPDPGWGHLATVASKVTWPLPSPWTPDLVATVWLARKWHAWTTTAFRALSVMGPVRAVQFVTTWLASVQQSPYARLTEVPVSSYIQEFRMDRRWLLTWKQAEMTAKWFPGIDQTRRTERVCSEIMDMAESFGHTTVPLETFRHYWENRWTDVVTWHAVEQALEFPSPWVATRWVGDHRWVSTPEWDHVYHVLRVASHPVDMLTEVDKTHWWDGWQQINTANQAMWDADQIQAIQTAIQHPYSMITGGPGTGKTTVIRAIVDSYQQAFPKSPIHLVAPTGMAADRMTALIHTEASTLHRWLGWTPTKTPDPDPLEPGLAILDEASMVDAKLMSGFMMGSTRMKRVVIVGDGDQLPPVSAGQPFRTWIDEKRYPVTRLTHNHRVSPQSQALYDVAHLWQQSPTPAQLAVAWGQKMDSWHPTIQWQHTQDLRDSIMEWARHWKQDNPLGTWEDVLLLTPYRQTASNVSVNNLQQDLRQVLHPDAVGLPSIPWQDPNDPDRHGSWVVGDWIMHIHNATLRQPDGESVWVPNGLRGQIKQIQWTVPPVADWPEWVWQPFDQYDGHMSLAVWLWFQWREDRMDLAPEWLSQFHPTWGLERCEAITALMESKFRDWSPEVTANRILQARVTPPDGWIGVEYPSHRGAGLVWYRSYEAARTLDWAYVTTVHKAQGSEASLVVLLLPEPPEGAMWKELVYTGMTRAKDRLLILGNPSPQLWQSLWKGSERWEWGQLFRPQAMTLMDAMDDEIVDF